MKLKAITDAEFWVSNFFRILQSSVFFQANQLPSTNENMCMRDHEKDLNLSMKEIQGTCKASSIKQLGHTEISK